MGDFSDKSKEMEKRRDARVAHHYIMRFKKTGPSSILDESWESTTVRNISKTGIYFYSASTHETAEELEIRIKNPLFPKDSVCWVRVVRCRPLEHMKGTFGVAVHIYKIDDETKEYFNKTIEFYIRKERRDESENY